MTYSLCTTYGVPEVLDFENTFDPLRRPREFGPAKYKNNLYIGAAYEPKPHFDMKAGERFRPTALNRKVWVSWWRLKSGPFRARPYWLF